MCGALDPQDRLRTFEFVVADRQTGGRADIVSQTGAGDDNFAFDAAGVEDRIIVIQRRNVRRTPAVEAFEFAVSGKVAAPGDARISKGHIFIQSGCPHGLQAALAAADDDYVFAVPFGQRFDILQGTHQAESHAVEVGFFRIAVLHRVKGIAFPIGFDVGEEFVIVFFGCIQIIAVSVDIEDDFEEFTPAE